MRPLTLIMAYYENHTMLQRHVHQFHRYDRKIQKCLRVIVVDDGSPKAPARLDSECPCPLEIYRMQVDVRWNQDACRNLGVSKARTEWILLTDIDHLVPNDTMAGFMSMSLNPEHVYKFSRVSEPGMLPYKPHPNSWLMTRAIYEKVGGYDERLAGWYGTDGDFLDRVAVVAPIVRLELPIVRVPREVTPDASTTTLTRKSDKDAAMIKILRAKYKGTPPLTLSFPWEKVL